MKHSILFDTDAVLVCLILFIAMGIVLSVGYYFGEKSKKTSIDDTGILGSMVGLFALLLAFTFGMAGTRFEQRKNNVIQEANDIGTAILRADIYPDSSKAAFKHDFEKYLDSRILFLKSKRNEAGIDTALKNSDIYSQKLWKRATFYGKQKEYLLQGYVMLPALNSMFDSAATTNALFNTNVPETILYLLFVFALIISFYVGFDAGVLKHIEKIYLFGFCFLTAIVIYTILDLDRPRRGAISIENEIQLVVNLKSNFK